MRSKKYRGRSVRRTVNLWPREQETAGTENIAGGRSEIARSGCNRLDAAQPAILINVGEQPSPGLLHHWLVFRPIQNAGVDSIGKAISIKSRAGGFGQRVGSRIQQSRPPESVRPLKGRKFFGHLF